MKSSSEVFASVEFQYSVSAESLSKWALFSDSPRLLCGGRVPDPPPLPVICPGVTNAGDTRDIGHPGHSYSRTSTCWSSSEPNGFSKIISITASAQSIIQSVFFLLFYILRTVIISPLPLHFILSLYQEMEGRWGGWSPVTLYFPDISLNLLTKSGQWSEKLSSFEIISSTQDSVTLSQKLNLEEKSHL